jgi:hypothetical protein
MTGLKGKGHRVTQIKSQQNNNDMQHPPAGLISHKIFQHVISRANGQAYTQWICLKSVLATSRSLKN